MRGAGAFRSYSNRRSAQIGEGLEISSRPAEQQQGLEFRQPPEKLKPKFGSDRRAVLNQSEHLAAARFTRGKAIDILDRTCGLDHCELSTLALRAFGEPRRQCMILAARNSGEDRSAQI